MFCTIFSWHNLMVYLQLISAEFSLRISCKYHQIVSTEYRAKHCFKNEWTLAYILSFLDITKYFPLSNGDSVQKPLFAYKTIFILVFFTFERLVKIIFMIIFLLWFTCHLTNCFCRSLSHLVGLNDTTY